MAKLYFHYATMNAGKSAHLLQANHNYTSQGMSTLILSSSVDTRSGSGRVSSRLGISADAEPFGPRTDLFSVISQALAREPGLRCVFVDEAQFLSPKQAEQLAKSVDVLSVPVMAYGLRTDFTGNLFPGSEALFRLADEMREIRSVCWCGKRATMVMRIDGDGRKVIEGRSVVVGGDDMYASVCRAHWFSGESGRSRAPSCSGVPELLQDPVGEPVLREGFIIDTEGEL